MFKRPKLSLTYKRYPREEKQERKEKGKKWVEEISQD